MNHSLFASTIKNLTILYVEDDENIQMHIAEFLKRYTSRLYLANNAEDGLKLYEKIKPDILLLDINLPGMSGIDLAKIVRKNDLKTRIIISTAYTDKEFLLTAVELTLTRYLVKPVTSIELVNALSKAALEYNNDENTQLIDLGKGYFYNKASKLVLLEKKEIHLRRKEMQLLEFFIANKEQTLSYDVLEYEVWQERPMSKDAIRAQIRNIRKKTHSDIIENISAIGYRLYDGINK
ncbi:response regulator transcription factor [Sulfurimonas sp.]|uniref:response regulator transcription factor n=1 Tax=Sulfurimonas sp. TaxID=2022749 RepID=UPI00261ADACF|nr:response regulator transcription factor [Sulfurimonas sp.]